MGAFDLRTRTIRHKSWDKGEEVVIRELTYGESTSLTAIAAADISALDMEDEERRKQLKVGDMDMGRSQLATLEMSIVSWTLSKSGKVMPLNEKNIALIKGHYGEFIMEEIDKFSPDIDDDFPGEPGTSTQGEGEIAGDNDSG
jgi:hypothetical protein